MLILLDAVRRTLALLGSERRMRWVMLIVLALAVAGFEALGAILIFAVIGLVSGETSDVELPLIGSVGSLFPGVPEATLQLWLTVLVAVFFLVRTVVLIGQQYIQARLIHNAGARLSSYLVRAYIAMPYLWHTQRNSSQMIRNAFDSVSALLREVVKPAMEVITQLILVVGLTGVLLVVAPLATLIALGILMPLVWGLQALVQPRLKVLGRDAQESRQHALQALQQSLNGIRDIRFLSREEEFAHSFAKQRRIMSRTDYLKTSLTSVPQTLMETGLVMVIVAICVLAIVTDSQASAVPTLGVFAYTGLRLQPALRQIVQGLNHIRFGSAVIDDLEADRDLAESVLEAQRARAAEQGQPFEDLIDLRDVTFAYAPGAPPALRDVNLSIRRGEFVGICGPTGGGKSTLIDLITGLLQPTSGEVCVDGHRLSEYPAWWYAQLGVVSQSVYLTDDTLRRNIAFGAPDDEIDEVQLARAVKRAQLDDVIAGLPDGLETIVGERGVRLSGGQRQRVAVARALYREPSVVILDEGTSALDSATEAALVAAIDELKVGRTLISVAHRITTVAAADRIIVVQRGRIAVEGRHDELLQRSELFRALAG